MDQALPKTEDRPRYSRTSFTARRTKNARNRLLKDGKIIRAMNVPESEVATVMRNGSMLIITVSSAH